MRAFLKMPQEFQDDVVGNMDWTPPEMDSILEDREEMEKAMDGIDVDFEVAAFVASTETVDGIQLPLGYVMESSTQDIAGEITFEDPVGEELDDSVQNAGRNSDLDDSVQGAGEDSELNLEETWEGFSE